MKAGTALGLLSGSTLGRASAASASRTIPSSGERIPAIGMGSWITFDVGNSTRERDARVEVLEAFFAHGGGMIDSSPMYGTSEGVIGYCLGQLEETGGLFSANGDALRLPLRAADSGRVAVGSDPGGEGEVVESGNGAFDRTAGDELSSSPIYYQPRTMWRPERIATFRSPTTINR